jgi:hypothetical protein
MTPLHTRVTNLLSEGRILVLGIQIFIGVQLRRMFEPGFDELSTPAQYLLLSAQALVLIAFALAAAPASYHRIVNAGGNTPEFAKFVDAVMGVALLPVAVALAIEVGIASMVITGPLAAAWLGAGAMVVSLCSWYMLGILERRRRVRREEHHRMGGESGRGGAPDIDEKVSHVLTEARMVLPGAQALFGFQLAIVLMEAFEELPASSRYVHLVSLCLVALSVIWLMTPPAYHRIVERGASSQRFHGFASRMVVLAMVPLATGLAGDLFVVTLKVTRSLIASVIFAGAMLAFTLGLWFGYTLLARRRRR